MRSTFAFGLALMVVVVIAACSGHGTGKDPGDGTGTAGTGSAADPWLRKVPKPVKPGPYAVAYNCSHSMQPWGNGGSYQNMSADLARRTWTQLSYEYTGEPVAPGKPEEKPPAPTVTPMTAGAAATLGKAVDRLLAGGPYRQELPPSEGTPCQLTITDAAGAEVFSIDKAFTEEKDAASDLVKALYASFGR